MGIRFQKPAQLTKDTVSVAPGERYDVEFIATETGQWMLHCHNLHHTTNNNVEPGGLMMMVNVTRTLNEPKERYDMCRWILVIGLLFSTAIFLAACSSGAAPEDSASAKPVNIQVESNPNPAMMGDVTLTLSITDENGQPIESARVDVSVDHTDMTGMGMSGPATEQGEGA